MKVVDGVAADKHGRLAVQAHEAVLGPIAVDACVFVDPRQIGSARLVAVALANEYDLYWSGAVAMAARNEQYVSPTPLCSTDGVVVACINAMDDGVWCGDDMVDTPDDPLTLSGELKTWQSIASLTT